MDYFPFGNARISSSPGQRQYLGEVFDSETSLNYLNARYYKNDVGRFISQDPVFKALGNAGEIQQLTQSEQNKVLEDPQSLNSYSYARNNPITLSDPNGEFYQFAIGALAGFVGGGASQYAHDIVTNLENGQNGLRALLPRSSLGEYAKSAGEGTLVGVSFAAGGPLLAGVSSGTLSVADDIRQNKPISWSKATVDASVTSLVGYGTGLFPKVRGREPGLFTTAFFSGRHTQNEVVKEAISVGASFIKESAAKITKSLKNDKNNE